LIDVVPCHERLYHEIANIKYLDIKIHDI
jgi:hypothetical protein